MMRNTFDPKKYLFYKVCFHHDHIITIIFSTVPEIDSVVMFVSRISGEWIHYEIDDICYVVLCAVHELYV